MEQSHSVHTYRERSRSIGLNMKVVALKRSASDLEQHHGRGVCYGRASHPESEHAVAGLAMMKTTHADAAATAAARRSSRHSETLIYSALFRKKFAKVFGLDSKAHKCIQTCLESESPQTSKPRVSNITFSTVTSATGLPTIAAEPCRPRSSRIPTNESIGLVSQRLLG
ncbi:hypothetical protein TELCIR_03367 [Teladorsagia circumcincta]|uniref:Uncharacterized protein n=1 Tax=Teladorsagia circumcincta TaxID=45464 RepID=A0A2G9UYP5_TELCI|nr:hypothetical protein TELCIR_03367 [Teladorsagia circumcincta]